MDARMMRCSIGAALGVAHEAAEYQAMAKVMLVDIHFKSP